MIRGIGCPALVDTGASVSIIAKHFLDRLGWEIDAPATTTLVIANGKRSVPLGEMKDVPVQFGTEIIPIRMIVTNAKSYNVILGMSWLKKAKAKIDTDAQKLMFYNHGRKFSIPLDIQQGVLP